MVRQLTAAAPLVLRYDEPTVASILAALRVCPPAARLDSMAAVVKVFVEDDLAVRFGVASDRGAVLGG